MKHGLMCKCGKLGLHCEHVSEGLNNIVIHAKKEVFDDILKVIDKVYYSFNKTDTYFELGFDKLKKRIQKLRKESNTKNTEKKNEVDKNG